MMATGLSQGSYCQASEVRAPCRTTCEATLLCHNRARSLTARRTVLPLIERRSLSEARALQLPRYRASTLRHECSKARASTSQREQMQQGPQRSSCGIVISGGTSGLGFCLAREFVQMGDRVVICGRSTERVNAAVVALQSYAPNNGASGAASAPQVFGKACDVGDAQQVCAVTIPPLMLYL